MPDARKIKLIIFDWDDVFTLGSKEGYFECYHRALIGVGVKLQPEEERKRILLKWSQPHREELRELLKERPELLDRACSIYQENLLGDTFVSHLSLVPGSRELLRRLHERYVLAIASGINSKLLLGRIFPKFEIPNVFSQIVTARDAGPDRAKPDPFMVERVMETQGVLPGETVLVGDASSGIRMAQAAKVTPVAVLTGNLSRDEAVLLGVRYVIDDVGCLDGVLKEISDMV